MRAAVRLMYGDVEPRCPTCRKPGAEELRRIWGCDEPSTARSPERPDVEGQVWWMTCPRCDGTNEECEKCGGSGRFHPLRCPTSLIDRRTVDLLGACSAYGEHGALPAPGGRWAQAASFFHWSREINAERAAIDREKPKR